jgi:hypothetical protein
MTWHRAVWLSEFFVSETLRFSESESDYDNDNDNDNESTSRCPRDSDFLRLYTLQVRAVK